MKKHEIEALRRLGDNWLNKQNPHYFGAAKELEALLISLFGSDDPAPDDGLREGLAEIISKWLKIADTADKLGDTTYATALRATILDAERLLAKAPDGWQPIADAPRDGRVIIVGHIESAVCKVRSWDEEQGWIDEDGNQGLQDFTHYRPLPAPPREPCDSIE